jgi:hypothetical protein
MAYLPSQGGVEPIPGTENVEDFAVSHKGLLFAIVRGRAIYVKEDALWRRITTVDSPRDLAFGPNDDRLLCVAGPGRDGRIEAVNLSTGASETLISGEGDVARPALSPDGTMIAYAERPTGSGWRIRLKRLSDNRYREIGAPGCNCYAPAWRPGSHELIYATDCRRGVLLPRLVKVRAERP